MMKAESNAQPVILSRRGSDIAYGAYGFLGAVALWAARVIFPGSPTIGTGEYDAFVAGLGFLVAIPFGLPAVAALIVACWLTFRRWRDTWLVSLLLLTLAFIVYLFVWWNLESGWFQWFPMVLYGAVCTISGLWWFLFRRWRSPHLSAGGSGSPFPRSKLTPAGRWLTFLAFLALIAKGTAVRLGEGRPLLLLAGLLDLATIVVFPAGLTCWIIGAIRDRRARKGLAASQLLQRALPPLVGRSPATAERER